MMGQGRRRTHQLLEQLLTFGREFLMTFDIVLAKIAGLIASVDTLTTAINALKANQADPTAATKLQEIADQLDALKARIDALVI